jgi:hypothetical protein
MTILDRHGRKRLPAIFPDQLAPVEPVERGQRVMEMMLWGFPPPPNLGTRAVTNVRNTWSSYWRAWLNHLRLGRRRRRISDHSYH